MHPRSSLRRQLEDRSAWAPCRARASRSSRRCRKRSQVKATIPPEG